MANPTNKIPDPFSAQMDNVSPAASVINGQSHTYVVFPCSLVASLNFIGLAPGIGYKDSVANSINLHFSRHVHLAGPWYRLHNVQEIPCL